MVIASLIIFLDIVSSHDFLSPALLDPDCTYLFFVLRWREILNNKKCEGVTPMRRLIERFPQVAKVGLIPS